MTEDTRALGLAAGLGFAVLVGLLVALVISEDNLVGTAAGLVAIVTGILLGMFLWRTEPEAGAHHAVGPAGTAAADVAGAGSAATPAEGPATDSAV